MQTLTSPDTGHQDLSTPKEDLVGPLDSREWVLKFLESMGIMSTGSQPIESVTIHAAHGRQLEIDIKYAADTRLMGMFKDG